MALLCIPIILLGKPLGKVFSKKSSSGASLSSRKDSTRKMNKSKNIVSYNFFNFFLKKLRVDIESEIVELIPNNGNLDIKLEIIDVETNGTGKAVKKSPKEVIKSNHDEDQMVRTYHGNFQLFTWDFNSIAHILIS